VVTEAMRRVVATEPMVDLDYAVAVGSADLIEREVIEDPSSVRLLIAAIVGPVRLIDNSEAVEHAAPLPRVRTRQLERVG
jgi:pantothenate synthetase